MSLRGNPQTLRNIAKNIGDVPQVVRIRIAARAAGAITDLALGSFDAGVTPFGDAWAPGSEGQDVDLYESGALRATLRFVAIGGRVRCVMGVKYARFQVGKRRVLPAPGQTMPQNWRDAIAAISREEIPRALPMAA